MAAWVLGLGSRVASRRWPVAGPRSEITVVGPWSLRLRPSGRSWARELRAETCGLRPQLVTGDLVTGDRDPPPATSDS